MRRRHAAVAMRIFQPVAPLAKAPKMATNGVRHLCRLSYPARQITSLFATTLEDLRMTSSPTTTSVISWGRHQRFRFSACGQLDDWTAPSVPAVFAVTYRRDPMNKPKGHTVLLFGECEDVSQATHSIRQQVMDVWSENGGTSDELYVFLHAMPGSTRAERTRVKETLVIEYQPTANYA